MKPSESNAPFEERLLWCWKSNVGIRFESNKTVSAWSRRAKVFKVRRKTFDEAIDALYIAMNDEFPNWLGRKS